MQHGDGATVSILVVFFKSKFQAFFDFRLQHNLYFNWNLLHWSCSKSNHRKDNKWNEDAPVPDYTKDKKLSHNIAHDTSCQFI